MAKKAVAKTKVDKKQNARISRIENLLSDDDRMVLTAVTGALTVAGAVAYVSGTAQGVDTSNRIGDVITPQELEFRARVVSIASAAGRAYRFIMFQDMECQGVAPTVLDVLNTVNTLESSFNPVNKLNKRFNILFDRSFPVEIDNLIVNHVIRIGRKKLRKMKYLSTTAVIGHAGTGAIFLLTICDNVTTATTLNSWSSLTFSP